jgi:hypothetical protein
MGLHIYRVVVRGRFDGLDDDARDRLRAAAPEHDIFLSAFTPDGTLTYDHFIHAFNTRFELRADGDPAENEAAVGATALARTEDLLAALGVRGRDHRVTITDMASIWS